MVLVNQARARMVEPTKLFKGNVNVNQILQEQIVKQVSSRIICNMQTIFVIADCAIFFR